MPQMVGFALPYIWDKDMKDARLEIVEANKPYPFMTLKVKAIN